MSSTKEDSWEASVHHLSLLNPSLAPILSELPTRELLNPIYICVECTKETDTQQAMASHCRPHVCAGMAKGSVRHIKYNPDHSYTMMCNNPQPRLRSDDEAPGSAADHVAPPQPPNQTDRQAPTAGSCNILAYAGQPFIAHIARSPFLQFNRPNLGSGGQPTINADLAHAATFTLAFDRQTLVRYSPTGHHEIASPDALFVPVILPKMDLEPGMDPTTTADYSSR